MKPQTGRRFISEVSDEHGNVSWYVEDTYFTSLDKKHVKRASLTLADCDRRIRLEFDYENRAEYNQRIEKVNSLLEEIESFKEALIDSWGKV